MSQIFDPNERALPAGELPNRAGRLLRNDEAAALIGIKPVTLKIWRVKGRGPEFIKLGDTKQSGVVYYEQDVRAWLEGRKFRSTSAYIVTSSR